MHVLILGGTRDAMTLADELLDHPRLEPVYSLAGRTRRPLPAALPTRRGGFGGVVGLKDWLRQHQTAAVVDATHPFAAGMSHNAASACAELGLPLARLNRAPWQPGPGDHWYPVRDLDEAAQQVQALTGSGDAIWLTTGRTSLANFESIRERFLLVRCVDPPDPEPAFPHWALIEDRGPFTQAGEAELIRQYRIAALVTKNSGGAAARAKLDATREAGLPVVMVDRPALPPVDAELDSPSAVCQWLNE